MIRVLVSACLLGERVRYDGRDATSGSAILARWEREGRLVRFCPEVAGGLPVPRPAAEIAGEDGRAVLEGRARVVLASGQDVSAAFLEGARLALAAARAAGARLAVLKEGSPSCGSATIYDGTFSGTRKRAAGVTAALLGQAGIAVFSERQLAEAEAYLTAAEKAEA